MLFYSPTGRRFILGKKLFHRFFDPLLEILKVNGYRGYIIEEAGATPTNRRKARSRFATTLGHVPYKEFNFEKEMSAKYKIETKNYDSFLLKIANSQLGPSAHELKIENFIAAVINIRALKSMFLAAIRPTKIRICLIDCFYHWTAFALTLACRELGILTVELQHGVQGAEHPTYAPWVKQPKGGFNLIPDTFWCWDEESAKNIRAWHPGGEGAVKIGGNPAVMYWQTPAGKEHLTVYGRQIRKLSGNAKKNILVTLAMEQFPDWFGNVIRRSDKQIFWWFRRHPLFPHENLDHLEWFHDPVLASRINIEDAGKFPLYALLQYSNLHITKFSSSIIEAESFGIPSLTFYPQCLKMFYGQYERGTLLFAPTEEEFITVISEQMQRNRNGARAKRNEPEEILLSLLRHAPDIAA